MIWLHIYENVANRKANADEMQTETHLSGQDF